MPRRTVPRWAHLAATALAGVLALGLTGCSGDSKPTQAPTLEVTSSEPPSSSPVADPVKAAGEVIGGYRQMIVDLYSGRVTDVDELKRFATGDRLIEDKETITGALAAGRSASVGDIEVVWVEKSGASTGPQEMMVLACIDAGAISFTDENGTARAGRDVLVYQLSTHRGGWKIVSVVPPISTPSRKC